MLVGEKPYAGEDANEILKNQCESPIPKLPADIAEFQTLIDRLLAKAPRDRIASARELVGMIEPMLAESHKKHYALSASSA
jgi:serine/threonine protein kinase